MRLGLRLTLAASTLIGAATSAACSPADCYAPLYGNAGAPSAEDSAKNAGSSSSGGQGARSPQNAAPAPDAARAIAEADIVQLDQEQLRIYAMTKAGAVAIVDAATPGKLTLLGRTSLSGEPFEMYRRGNVLLTMSNRAVSGSGQVKDPLPPDEGFTVPSPDPTSSALLIALDVTDPAAAKTVGTFEVPGEIADSRIVGDVLYVATYENAACHQCASEPRTLVTTFDVKDPLAPKKIDQISFPGSATSFKRSVTATTQRFYVGGVNTDVATASDEGQIDVVDITDPSGQLTKGAHLTVPGPITSRWQMDESAGSFRVITQRGVLTSENGDKYPDVDVFRVDSSTSMPRVGHVSMKLPQQEGLKSVRFDGTRAYAITFLQRVVRPVDPLFVIDLADPTTPVQRGELEMPGWVFHMEPRGDRLLALGLDRENTSGSLNVSLFDVANMDAPSMISRVSFGPSFRYTDAQITSGVMAEDQDRIQKAFRIFSDGLIAVPFSAPAGAGDSCTSGAGIELLSWTPNSLTRHSTVPMVGNPRRAVRRDSDAMRELIAISDSNVRSFAIDDRSRPLQTADVVIGRCVPKSISPGTPGGEPVSDGWEGQGDRPSDMMAYDRSSGSSCY
jgi:hypothetical protein